jgi:molybdopterin synthase sulfur carrier subunit
MKLLYFAWLRQRIGIPGEDIDLPEGVGTVQELVAWLRDRGGNYAEALANPAIVRVAVNQAYAQPGDPVSDTDEVALFPPVTGG